MRKRSCLAVLVIALGWSTSAAPADLTGRASVIDGDTIEIHGQRVRLHGVDAPEGQQLCESEGKQYRCGQTAALKLADHIGQRTVACDQRDTDRYGRVVATCRLGTEDIGAWLVSQGWALAYRRYSRGYIEHEEAAKAASRGIWRGPFIAPWAWRQGKRLPETAAPSPPRDVRTAPPADRCPIKGNISRNGERIYHVPDQQYYAQTRINETNGERWFCTEAEAQAAGWRKAKR